MIYEIKDMSKVKSLFEGWQETLIYSCLQNVMGKIYVTDLENPRSAFAFVGCFGFYAGEPDRELIMNKPEGFVKKTFSNHCMFCTYIKLFRGRALSKLGCTKYEFCSFGRKAWL